MDLKNIINFDTSGAVVFNLGIFIISIIAIAIIALKGKRKSK